MILIAKTKCDKFYDYKHIVNQVYLSCNLLSKHSLSRWCMSHVNIMLYPVKALVCFIPPPTLECFWMHSVFGCTKFVNMIAEKVLVGISPYLHLGAVGDRDERIRL